MYVINVEIYSILCQVFDVVDDRIIIKSSKLSR